MTGEGRGLAEMAAAGLAEVTAAVRRSRGGGVGAAGAAGGEGGLVGGLEGGGFAPGADVGGVHYVVLD